MTGFMKLVESRRSIRSYSSRKVPREMIMKCVRAARFAPTACNKQRVKIIIAAEKAKDRLVSEALGIPPVRNRWASRAPVIAVFAVDRDLVVHRIASGLRKIYYDFIDAGIAGEHFVLQATELGLGTCWLGWFRKKQVSEILRLPGNWRVCAMITLGFPNESPGEKRIIPESESVLFRYGGNDE